MATSVGEIGLDLVVNQNQFNSQMNSIASTAKKAGAVLAAAFSVKALVNFGKECLELGSDLAEVQNVVDVTFSTMSNKVGEFSKSALTTYGLSETMAKQYTGTFGAMAKAFGFSEDEAYNMSTALTGLAGDVASFYNISQDEAYTKLKSVFSGETETLKDLGVVMTQSALDSYALANGIGKTTSQMTEAEKVTLRYKFVSEQLAAAQGDFARTSDSWANQVRILKLQFDSLKGTIGQGLINLFTPIIKVINTLIGKLATAANAFKSFTELITGKKSSGTTSTVSSVGDAAENASTGYDDATTAAGNLSDANDSVADSAKSAAKAMRSVMGFDELNKLSDNSTDSSSSSPSSGSGSSGTGSGSGSGTALGDAVDFGNIAEGETAIDKISDSFDGLIKRCKELAAIFKKGFKIGFGDSEKTIKSIKEEIKSIGKSLQDIFTDPKVVSSANSCMNAIALAMGKTVGSMASIGLSIGDNLLGGVSKYLAQNKEFIKRQIINTFDAVSDIAELSGNYKVACAQIFEVFTTPQAKQITADIIAIFSNGFLGVVSLITNFIADIYNLLVTPITNNVGLIKQTLDGVLSRWQIVFDAIALSVTTTVSKIQEVYTTYISPFFQSLTDGVSQILKVVLEGWNTYMSPVLDNLAKKFSDVWTNNIQPAINGVLDLIGKVFLLVQTLWETWLVPFITWLINNIYPVIAPVVEKLGNILLDFLKLVGNVITGVTGVLSGVITFLTGVFSGDWSLAWEGIKEIVNGFKKILSSIITFIKDSILTPIKNWIRDTFQKAWETAFNAISGFINTFKETVSEKVGNIKSKLGEIKTYVSETLKNAWKNSIGRLGDIFGDFKDTVSGIVEDIKDEIAKIASYVAGTFKQKWKKAWDEIKGVVKNLFKGVGDMVKPGLNSLITAFNSIIWVVNSLIRKINSIRFKLTIPSWVPGFGGSSLSFSGFNIPSIASVPYLAQGGYVKPNTPQLAMIGDNKHQGEFVAPEGKLQAMALEAAKTALSSSDIANAVAQGVSAAMMNGGGSAPQYVVASFSIGENEIAKAVAKAQNKYNSRMSASPAY